MIDKVHQLTDTNDLANMQKIFDNIHEQAMGIIHTDKEPTADTVPAGKIVVYDNGTNRRVYIRTGKEGVGYFTLNML